MRREPAWLVSLAALAVAACATNPPPITTAELAGGSGAAILIVLVQQNDAANRSGTITLRRIDPATRKFLPSAKDTLVEIHAIPAFRYSDIFAGSWNGARRANFDDFTVARLAPGEWAVERATHGVAGPGGYGGNSLVDAEGPQLPTMAFNVEAGRIIALPPLDLREASSTRQYGFQRTFVSPRIAITGGPPGYDATAVVENKGLDPAGLRDGEWINTTVDCGDIQNSHKFLQYRSRAGLSCEPW
jgi:hypothetical protein